MENEKDGFSDEVSRFDIAEGVSMARDIIDAESEQSAKIEIKKRTDWANMALEVIALISRLQNKPTEMKMGYSLSPGGILNAYREGDLTFKQAVKALEKWRQGKQGKKYLTDSLEKHIG